MKQSISSRDLWKAGFIVFGSPCLRVLLWRDAVCMVAQAVLRFRLSAAHAILSGSVSILSDLWKTTVCGANPILPYVDAGEMVQSLGACPGVHSRRRKHFWFEASYDMLISRNLTMWVALLFFGVGTPFW